jgi:hypothetical protein
MISFRFDVARGARRSAVWFLFNISPDIPPALLGDWAKADIERLGPEMATQAHVEVRAEPIAFFSSATRQRS